MIFHPLLPAPRSQGPQAAHPPETVAMQTKSPSKGMHAVIVTSLCRRFLCLDDDDDDKEEVKHLA